MATNTKQEKQARIMLTPDVRTPHHYKTDLPKWNHTRFWLNLYTQLIFHRKFRKLRNMSSYSSKMLSIKIQTVENSTAQRISLLQHWLHRKKERILVKTDWKDIRKIANYGPIGEYGFYLIQANWKHYDVYEIIRSLNLATYWCY